ncbi:MAG: PAS domain S-box protein [Dehalococcoidia bacterium]
MTPSDDTGEPGRLAALQERLALVLQATHDGIWDWDLRTNQVYFSSRWKSMLGYDEHAIPGRFDAWQTLVHPDDHDEAMAQIAAHLAGETPFYQFEHRLRHKDGSYRWILARGMSLRDDSGQAYRMVGSHTDMTERRHVEERLREREAQYRGIFEATTDGVVLTDLYTERLLDVNPAFCRMHGYTREELVGAHPSLFIHPDSAHLFREYVDAVTDGRTYQCQAVDIRKDGSLVPVEVHGGGFIFRGKRCILGIVRDITDRVEAYQLLEQRVAERTRELSTLLDVSRTVASTLDVGDLFGIILDQLKVVADYSGASVLTRDGDDFVLREARPRVDRSAGVIGLRFPMQPNMPLVDVLARRESIIVADVLDDAPYAVAYRAAVGERMAMPFFSQVRSWLAVPMMLGDQVTGILSLIHDQPGFYTPRHAELASAIANQAAVALENATLYERAQSLAVLEERQRLARDLHDSVTQSLFSLSMISDAVPKLLDRRPDVARERLARLNELAHGALAEMRALLFELRPESLEREGLVAALEKQIAAMKARHQLVVTAAMTTEPELSLEGKEALYRIAQEALHNTVKHAQAAHVELRLTAGDDGVCLEVEDDGIGFDPSVVFPGHLGQQSMRERAERLGGAVLVRSAPGDGTCVRALIPHSATNAAHDERSQENGVR